MTTTAIIIKAIGNAVSRLICLGSSVSLTVGLLSKLIQYIRFLNIQYPARLENVLLTWGTDVLNLNIPTEIDQRIVAYPIPDLFTQYGLEPSFLSNIWGFLIIILSACAAWIICRALMCYFQSSRRPCLKFLRPILTRLSKSISNFIVVQIYSGIGDTFFFLSLEMKSVSFKSAWSYVSFLLSLIFMLLGLGLLVLLGIVLVKYRRIKIKSSEDTHIFINQFNKKYQSLLALYADFSDVSLLKHGFLFIIVTRDIIIGLTIANMMASTPAQLVILVCTSFLMCISIIFRNPYRKRFDQVSQAFLEMCVLVVFVCVTMLAAMGEDEYSMTIKDSIASAIITMNIILNCGGGVIMGLAIFFRLWHAYKKYIEKKNRRVQTVADTSILNKNSKSWISIGPQNQRSFIESSHQRMTASITYRTTRTPNQQESELGRRETLQFQEDSFNHSKYSFNEDQTSMQKLENSILKANALVTPERPQGRLQPLQESASKVELENNSVFLEDLNLSGGARIPEFKPISLKME